MTVYWIAERAEGVPEDDGWLSPREAGVLAGLRVAKRRADWRLGRWTAKRAVAARLGIAGGLAGIEVLAAPGGQPEVWIGGRRAGIAIALSHSDGMGFCAVADHGAIGCDVERVQVCSGAFVADYFTEAEQALVVEAGESGRARMATLVWSAKESALKVLGCGLRADTREVEVVRVDEVDSGGGWRGLRVRARSGGIMGGWWREGDGFIWTLLAPRPRVGRALTCRVNPVI